MTTYQIEGGVWVERDWYETVEGTFEPVFEGWVVEGGVWVQFYERDIPTTVTVTSGDLPDVIVEVDTHPPITGTVFDFRGEVPSGTVDVTLDGAATETVPLNPDGSWTFTPSGPYTQVGTFQYRVDFVPDGPPVEGSTAYTNFFGVNSASVVLTILTQPTGDIVRGDEVITASGTSIREDANPALGTIVMLMINDDGNESGVWDTMEVQPDGSWQTTRSHWSGVLGNRQVKFDYTPLAGGIEEPASALGATWTCVLDSPGTLVPGYVGTGEVNMSYSEVSGRDDFQVYRNGSSFSSSNGTSYKNTGGVAQYTTYSYKLRARGTTPAGVTVYGPFTNERSARTARSEVRDSGAKTVQFQVSKTGSWRDVDAWGGIGDRIGQGTYGTYGSYRGVMDFGGNYAARDALRSSLGGGSTGSNRQLNGSCTRAQVWLSRNSGSGNSSGRPLSFYTSRSNVGGGQPTGTHGPYTHTGWPWNQYGWIDVSTTLGQYMGDGNQRSVIIVRDGTADYSIHNGKSSGSNDGDLRVDWTWNYVVTSAQSGVWL